MPILLAAVGALVLFVAMIAAIVSGTIARYSSASATGACSGAAQPAAGKDAAAIPPAYLRLYQAAGRRYGIPWTVLAGIGKSETDHGRNITTSSAGAQGPMQFMPGTWANEGIDGDGDGRKNINDPADAIFAAANYLRHSGAPAHMRQAIYTYNNAWWYVDKVLAYARQYAATGPVRPANGDSGDTGCIDGPVSAPNQIAAKVIAYAKAQLGKPYIYGGTGPRGYDCSGLTMMAYRSAGISIPRLSDAQFWWGPRIPDGHEEPGDLVYFEFLPGHSGPGQVAPAGCPAGAPSGPCMHVVRAHGPSKPLGRFGC